VAANQIYLDMIGKWEILICRFAIGIHGDLDMKMFGNDEPKITFPAEIIRVKTMMDNSIRVELSMPEDCVPQMAMLAECKRQGVYLVFTAVDENYHTG
jgi:hypothetical protein